MNTTTRLAIVRDGIRRSPGAIDGVKVIVPWKGSSIHVHITREGLIIDRIQEDEIIDTNHYTYQEILMSLAEEEA